MFDNVLVKVLSYEAREAFFVAEVERQGLKESYRIALLASMYGVDPASAAHRILNVSQGHILDTRNFGSVNVWRALMWPTCEKLNHRDITELGERLDRASWKFELDYDMSRFDFNTLAPLSPVDRNPENAMMVIETCPMLKTFVGDEPLNMRVAAGAWAYHYRRHGERALIAINDIYMVKRGIKSGSGQRAIRTALRDGRATFLVYTSTWMRSIAGSNYTLLHHNEPVRWTATFEAR